ncbi:MAG: right-handed parallel beta-helix repeat-containing protein [Anaerolineales bacterium]|nr:right-handed parallel beta-helix repeat-containing protein [Anaerolineales bacterium]
MRTLKMVFHFGILFGMLFSLQLSNSSANHFSSPEPVEGGDLYPPSSTSGSDATLELYSTFHAMGVNIEIGATDDPDGDATASVAYRTGSNAFKTGFPLSRVSNTRFSGSLFWLTPGTNYDVRVTFTDPDGSLNGVTLLGSATTRSEIVTPAPTHSYYVSPNGSGTACQQSSPCALTYGIGQVKAGEEVVLLGGVYYQGGIEIPRSGNVNTPIVIRGMAGQTAILDGGDPENFSWTHIGNGIYQTTVNVPNPHLVTADGQRLYPYQQISDLYSDQWEIPGFNANDEIVSVRLDGNANPNNADMVVSRHNLAFLVEKDYIYFQNLTFRYYGNGDYAKAIYLNNANFNLIQNCTFAINDLGIGIKRDSGENLIDDNEFYDTVFNWPWDAVKNGSSLETGGVRFYSPTTGRGNIIRGNTFHDYFDGFGACPEDAGEDSIEVDVYNNLAYNIGDDGMETDGTCSNVRIWNNTFHDVLMAISLAPTWVGPTYAIRNLIYNTGVGNNDYSGSPFKFNSGYAKSGPMYLFHNTSDAALPGNNGIYIKAPGSWELIYARNNIWAGTDYAINNYNTSRPIDLDYDNLYTTNPGEFVYWDMGEIRRMHDLLTFQTLTGQEANGLNEAPSFSNPPAADYTLALDSPLIDEGVYIPGINDGYNGTAPDIGAFEYEGSGFKLVVQPPNQAIDPGETTAFQISLETTGNFTDTVNLSYDITPSGLLADLTPTVIASSTSATLTVTDTHVAPLINGLLYTIHLSGIASAGTESSILWLLVGGERFYMPVVLR